MRETDIIEGVQNYVVNWARVQRGEHVLVVADSIADRMVVDLIAAVAKGQGANVVVAWIDFNPRQTQGAGPIIGAALQGADKLLRLNFALSHDKDTSQALQEYGVSMYGVCNPVPQFFASEAARFPVELTHAILHKTLEIVWREKVTTVRVTDPKGTDVQAKGYAKDWGGDYMNSALRWDMPGVYPRTFPGAIVGLVPPFAGEGVAIFDAYSGIGICQEPLKLTFEDNHCTHIEGGIEASKLRSMIRGIPGGNFLCEIMFGLNPKIRSNAPLDQKPIPNEAERRAGNLHIGMGNRPLWSWVFEEMKGVKGPYRQSHLDGFLVKPSVYVNGEPIIEGGHLTILDDPQVREVAKKYGDPEELLAEAGPA
jgi:hypothetical protein